ncbi:MAG: hypothetical protein ACHQIH_00035 [Ignavibacteria bacterium]
MTEENDVNYPATGASASFAIGFLIAYVIIVFAVLGIFFKIPF